MNILLVLLVSLVFVLAFIVVPYYECKIKNLSKNPKNNVHFYVKQIQKNLPWLYIQRRNGTLELIACTENFIDFGLNQIDFYDMKVGEIREVFLNLED